MNRTLALAAVVLCVACGGNVEVTAPDAGAGGGPDASCIPGAPACPVGDGAAGTSADGAGGADAADGADATAPDAALDAVADVVTDADAAPCAPVDGAVGPCDPIAQCGCPPGQSCANPTAEFNDAGQIIAVTDCRVVGPTGADADYCIHDEDCAAGLGCERGVCAPYCFVDQDCEGTDPFRACVHPGPYRPYGTCTRQCDPADPLRNGGGFYACGQNARCGPAPWIRNGLSDCAAWSTAATVGPGAACDDTKELTRCGPGYLCAAPDDGSGKAGCDQTTWFSGCTGVCRRWCHVGESGCEGGPCVPTGQNAGAVELGLCP